jgi:hypothetical protein
MAKQPPIYDSEPPLMLCIPSDQLTPEGDDLGNRPDSPQSKTYAVSLLEWRLRASAVNSE